MKRKKLNSSKISKLNQCQCQTMTVSDNVRIQVMSRSDNIRPLSNKKKNEISKNNGISKKNESKIFSELKDLRTQSMSVSDNVSVR